MMDNYMAKKTNVVTFLLGVLLLTVGVLLLMNRAGVLNTNFERVIGGLVVVAGGFEATTAFASSSRAKLFSGSALFLSGLLAILVSFDFVPGSWDQIWPTALIITGLSFLMLYFANFKEYLLLVVSVLLVASGVMCVLIEKGGFNMVGRFIDSMHFLVPAMIAVVGIYLVWKNYFDRKS